MLTLGIETSCDETAASIVRDARLILSNVVLSSINLHKNFGGIIPEIAHRFHLKFIDQVVKDTLKKAKASLDDIDCIAVTYGPGLIGALLVGVSYAKSLSYALKKPLIGINHLHAHMYAALMKDNIKFPFVGLVVSGGHTLLILVKDYEKFVLLGQTQDDAVGEAFDKVAKILKLGFPGGPLIDKLSKRTKRVKIKFPRSYLGKDSLDFSFSGLKTAVLYYTKDNFGDKEIPMQDKINIACGFQESVVDVLVHKALIACRNNRINRLVVGGGVSRNSRLRQRLFEETKRRNLEVYFPDFELCLDNAAMVAGLGYQRYKKNLISDLSLTPKADLKI